MHRRLGFEIWDTIRPFSYLSFDKKLFYIYKLYTKWINENINNKNHKFHIWEIDTIVTMMIMIKNGNGLAIENNDYKIIITAINKIRETIPPNTNEENVLTNLFSSILTQQLSSQRTFIPRLLYRYDFIFNHPNIIGVFREKFLIDPYDFLS